MKAENVRIIAKSYGYAIINATTNEVIKEEFVTYFQAMSFAEKNGLHVTTNLEPGQPCFYVTKKKSIPVRFVRCDGAYFIVCTNGEIPQEIRARKGSISYISNI
jgi:hypothetical protein